MPKFDVVDWMYQRGHIGYAREIADIESVKDEIRAEAGPNGHLCPFTQEAIAKEDLRIEEVRQAAQDRFDDWNSDY